jgi:hypothetical protein
LDGFTRKRAKKKSFVDGSIGTTGTEEEEGEDKNQEIISTGCMITYIEPL